MSALSDFEFRLTEVESLLDKVAPGWSPMRESADKSVSSVSDLPVGALSRSSLVLIISYFEGFLKDLTDEVFDRILDDQVPCHRLPRALKGRAVMRHLELLRTSTDAGEVWGAVEQTGETWVALSGSGPVTAKLLPREETKRQVTSIEPSKINHLLRTLDDKDLRTGPMSKHAVRLRSLKQVRDNAVHGNERDLQPLGFADVSDALTLLRACAGDLSERVGQLVDLLLASGPANTAI